MTSASTTSNASNPIAASYDAQLRIRREAEERCTAQQDLNSWMSQMKQSNRKREKRSQQTKATKNESTKSNALIISTASDNRPSSDKSAHRKPIKTRKPSTDATAKFQSKCDREPTPTTQNATGHNRSSSSSSCEEERLRGNRHFAKGNYEIAIQCYTRCLGFKDASDKAVIYSNRAMAHLKLKNWTQAENDATSALQIDPNHIHTQCQCQSQFQSQSQTSHKSHNSHKPYKTYQRRSVARLSLGKLRAAMADACAAEIAAEAALEDIAKGTGEKGTGDKGAAEEKAAKSSLKEIRGLQKKVERALMDAVNKAPRRKIPVHI